METQPPEDTSALLRKINELQADISHMELNLSAQISKLKEAIERLSSLTTLSHMGYIQDNLIQSQEQNGGQMQIAEKTERYGRDKNNPPLIPEGTQLTCVRCDYQWVPHARRPQKCPKCRAPWWFPARWKWHQSQSPNRDSDKNA